MEKRTEGLWLIWYDGAPGDGRGVIVLHDGKILGGESAWYYSGTYNTDESGIDGSMTLIHYGKPSSKSAGGHSPAQSPVDLTIAGRWIDDDTIRVHAEPAGGGSRMEFEMRRPVSTDPVIL